VSGHGELAPGEVRRLAHRAAGPDAILDDVARPMAVAVSAGTVDTGAIDSLDAVRAVGDETATRMHVDGAYGAPAVLALAALLARTAAAVARARDHAPR
jgi:glutamate/tyrosine decarboxylase-like PLP-dependent enzyme